MKPLAQTLDVLLVQFSFAAQHLGNDAARSKHVHQIFLLQPVLVHQESQNVYRLCARQFVALGFEVFDQQGQKLGKFFFSASQPGIAAASGYILPGAVGTFMFQSSTNPPPATIPFGCTFWNGDNEWGFAYNGQAQQALCIPIEFLPPFWYWQRPRRFPPEGLGTTSVTIKGQPEGPSVTVTYDKLGNVIKMVHNPPVHRKS